MLIESDNTKNRPSIAVNCARSSRFTFCESAKDALAAAKSARISSWAILDAASAAAFDMYEEEAAKNCGSKQKKPPYDFLMPDKVNMAAVMAQPVNKYFPFN